MKSVVLSFLFLFSTLAPAGVFQETSGEALRGLPVQADGRVMPFDSFAREMLELVYGKQKYEKRDAYEIILTWMLAPQTWQSKELFEIRNFDVLTRLGLDTQKCYIRAMSYFRALSFQNYVPSLPVNVKLKKN